MRYCRWLSEREGFADAATPYPAIPATAGDGDVALPADFLARPGYRLPTEAEWEIACRAGSTTPRFFGRGTELTAGYGWTLADSDERLHPAGGRRPNDAGLFDTLGGVWDLCHPTSALGGPGVVVEDGGGAGLRPAGERAFYGRGGSFLYLASFSRSAVWYPRPPATADKTVGFRVARTLAAHPPR